MRAPGTRQFDLSKQRMVTIMNSPIEKGALARLSRNPSFYVFVLLMCLIGFAYSLVTLDMQSDEGAYLQIISSYPSLQEFSAYCYNNLNGRIVPNTLSYFFLKYNWMFLWRCLSFGAVWLLACSLARCFSGRNLKNVCLIVLLLFCGGFRLVCSSSLWFIGAIFYLWPAALLCYLLANLADDFYHRSPIRFSPKFWVDLVLGVAVALWGEQPALLLLGFYFVYILYKNLLAKEHSHPAQLLCLVVWTISFLFLFFSPAQSIRINGATDYAVLDRGVQYFLQHILYWFFNTVFVQLRYLILLAGLLVLLCWRSRKRTWYLTVFEILYPMSLAGVLLHLSSAQSYIDLSKFFFGFKLITKASFTTLFPYIYWTLYMVFLLVLFFRIIQQPLVSALVLLAGTLSLCIMFFSPSMYISGQRTSFFFCIAVISLCTKLMSEQNCEAFPIVASIGLLNLLSLAGFYAVNGFVIYY